MPNKPTELKYKRIKSGKLKKAFQATYDWLKGNASSVEKSVRATHPVFNKKPSYESTLKEGVTSESLIYSFYEKDGFVAANIHAWGNAPDQLLGERTAEGTIEFFAQIDRCGNLGDGKVVALRGHTPQEVRQKIAHIQQHFGLGS